MVFEFNQSVYLHIDSEFFIKTSLIYDHLILIFEDCVETNQRHRNRKQNEGCLSGFDGNSELERVNQVYTPNPTHSISSHNILMRTLLLHISLVLPSPAYNFHQPYQRSSEILLIPFQQNHSKFHHSSAITTEKGTRNVSYSYVFSCLPPDLFISIFYQDSLSLVSKKIQLLHHPSRSIPSQKQQQPSKHTYKPSQAQTHVLRLVHQDAFSCHTAHPLAQTPRLPFGSFTTRM